MHEDEEYGRIVDLIRPAFKTIFVPEQSCNYDIVIKKTIFLGSHKRLL